MTLLLKRFSALLLAVSFFLPLTQCSQKLGETSQSVTMSGSNAYEWPGVFSTIAFLLFFWPLAMQLWRAMKGSRLPSRKVLWIEVGLSAVSIAGISLLVFPWSLNFGASIRYGAYLAYGSVLTYGGTSLAEAIRSGSAHERRS